MKQLKPEECVTPTSRKTIFFGDDEVLLLFSGDAYAEHFRCWWEKQGARLWLDAYENETGGEP